MYGNNVETLSIYKMHYSDGNPSQDGMLVLKHAFRFVCPSIFSNTTQIMFLWRYFLEIFYKNCIKTALSTKLCPFYKSSKVNV